MFWYRYPNPMKFTSVQEFLSETQGELNLCLINLKIVNGCTDYLLKNDNVKSWRSFNNQTYDENKIFPGFK